MNKTPKLAQFVLVMVIVCAMMAFGLFTDEQFVQLWEIIMTTI